MGSGEMGSQSKQVFVQILTTKIVPRKFCPAEILAASAAKISAGQDFRGTIFGVKIFTDFSWHNFWGRGTIFLWLLKAPAPIGTTPPPPQLVGSLFIGGLGI